MSRASLQVVAAFLLSDPFHRGPNSGPSFGDPPGSARSAGQGAARKLEALDLRFVDLNAEPWASRERDRALADRQRVPGNVFGEIETSEAHAPIHRGSGAGKMDRRRGRRDAGFRDLRGDVDWRGRGAGARCAASTAALIPPSLISLSADTPAPQRSWASMSSASEWMPSSAPIGIAEMRVNRASALRSACASGCSMNSKPASRTPSTSAAGISQGQPAIGIGAERSGSAEAFRSASVDAISLSTALVPILSLKKPKPCARFACASAMSCSGVGLPRSHIGATAPRVGPPIEIDYRQAG